MRVCARSSATWPKWPLSTSVLNPADTLVDLNSVEKGALTAMEQESHEEVETCKNRIMGNFGLAVASGVGAVLQRVARCGSPASN